MYAKMGQGMWKWKPGEKLRGEGVAGPGRWVGILKAPAVWTPHGQSFSKRWNMQFFPAHSFTFQVGTSGAHFLLCRMSYCSI